MPVNAIVFGALALSSIGIIVYSAIMGGTETELEKQIEEIIERSAEKSLDLPTGSLDGALDEIEKVIEDEEEKKLK